MGISAILQDTAKRSLRVRRTPEIGITPAAGTAIRVTNGERQENRELLIESRGEPHAERRDKASCEHLKKKDIMERFRRKYVSKFRNLDLKYEYKHLSDRRK